jgi:mannose-6-phosphate isomerase
MIETKFPKPKDLGIRDWGQEELLILIPGLLTLKRLTILAGKKGGLQYHHKKDECGVLISGVLIIRFESKEGGLSEKILSPGEAFYFPPGSVHQEEAVTDCVIIEASSPHFNDRVRVEERFGLTDVSGLPSTSVDQVREFE